MDEPRIVAGVGSSVHSEVPGLGEQMEAACALAIHEAMRDGVSLEDSVEILRRKVTAMNAVRERFGLGPMTDE